MTTGNNSSKKSHNFEQLVEKVYQCQLCSEHLPYDPRPIVSLSSIAQIVVIGQAPGLIAHDTNKAWNDNSGVRLRQWLGIDENTFYDKSYLSLMPMGFCFPGYKNNADAPPRKECAPQWHDKLLEYMHPKLTILVGRYAQHYYLPHYPNLTAAVQEQNSDKHNVWVLPHPSGRNNRWLGRNPWFEEVTLPALKARVKQWLP